MSDELWSAVIAAVVAFAVVRMTRVADDRRARQERWEAALVDLMATLHEWHMRPTPKIPEDDEVRSLLPCVARLRYASKRADVADALTEWLGELGNTLDAIKRVMAHAVFETHDYMIRDKRNLNDAINTAEGTISSMVYLLASEKAYRVDKARGLLGPIREIKDTVQSAHHEIQEWTARRSGA